MTSEKENQEFLDKLQRFKSICFSRHDDSGGGVLLNADQAEELAKLGDEILQYIEGREKQLEMSDPDIENKLSGLLDDVLYPFADNFSGFGSSSKLARAVKDERDSLFYEFLKKDNAEVVPEEEKPPLLRLSNRTNEVLRVVEEKLSIVKKEKAKDERIHSYLDGLSKEHAAGKFAYDANAKTVTVPNSHSSILMANGCEPKKGSLNTFVIKDKDSFLKLIDKEENKLRQQILELGKRTTEKKRFGFLSSKSDVKFNQTIYNMLPSSNRLNELNFSELTAFKKEIFELRDQNSKISSGLVHKIQNVFDKVPSEKKEEESKKKFHR